MLVGGFGCRSGLSLKKVSKISYGETNRMQDLGFRAQRTSQSQPPIILLINTIFFWLKTVFEFPPETERARIKNPSESEPSVTDSVT